MSEIHPQARTTPRTRAERYNVSVATVRKWKRGSSCTATN
jgi:DNA-binding transcriptional regulator YiaG